MTTVAEYIAILAVSAMIGAVIGPPLGYWSVLWEDKVSRHRARCGVCQQRDACRAVRGAARHG